MARRSIGLSAPFSAPQVGAWAALALTACGFPLFFTPVMPLEATIPVTVFFMTLVLLSTYYGLVTQAIDPMDLRLAHALVERDEVPMTGLYRLYNKSFPDPDAREDTKQCWICDLHVSQSSMHCKFCNKCIGTFDHHCMWLNTCIGERNYKHFFRCMISLFVMEVSQLGIAAGLLIDSFIGPTNDRAEAWFGLVACRVVWIWFIIFNIVSIILIGQLLAFHLKLQRLRLTTYQFIVQDHREKRSLQERIDRMENQRTSMMAKAYEEKRPLEAYKLWIGRLCRNAGCGACDSMQIPSPPDPEANFANALDDQPEYVDDGNANGSGEADESLPEEPKSATSDEQPPTESENPEAQESSLSSSIRFL